MSKRQQPEGFEASLEKGHELQDANIRNVVVYGFGMLVFVVMMGFLFSVIVYRILARNSNGYPPAPQFQAPQNELPPTPRLEQHPWLDLKEFREAETKQLESYGWVDKTNGVVKIPIERAMDLIAQRGLPIKPAGSKASGNEGAPSGSPGKK